MDRLQRALRDANQERSEAIENIINNAIDDESIPLKDLLEFHRMMIPNSFNVSLLHKFVMRSSPRAEDLVYEIKRSCSDDYIITCLVILKMWEVLEWVLSLKARHSDGYLILGEMFVIYGLRYTQFDDKELERMIQLLGYNVVFHALGGLYPRLRDMEPIGPKSAVKLV
jgi:hypothetical protein